MAVPSDEELRALLSQFVSVRMVQMWGIDLTRFQFDQSMTWAMFFMNADGTIYGRYGTRSGMQKRSEKEISIAGFKHSLAAALDLHKHFIADRDAVYPRVLGKQTRHAPPWPRAEKIPVLAAHERNSRPFAAFSQNKNMRAHGVGCIHCHMVSTSTLMSLHKAQKPITDRLIWSYPMPDAIGMHMDPDARATVQRVFPNSAAALAGVRQGDEIVRFDGQGILSTADIQWVLHNTGEGLTLALELDRAGKAVTVKVELSADWRRRLGDWRFINLGVCMQIGGFQGRPGPGGGQKLAIRVQRVHRKRMSGIDLKKNDTITAVDGKREPMNLGALTRYLLDQKPGRELELTVRRQGRDQEHKVRLTLR